MQKLGPNVDVESREFGAAEPVQVKPAIVSLLCVVFSVFEKDAEMEGVIDLTDGDTGRALSCVHRSDLVIAASTVDRFVRA